jgi:hypothetical protein
MRNHWLQGTRITYQAPDTPVDPPDLDQPKGDPHGDEVLEGGADIPLFPEPKAGDDETPPSGDDPPEPEPKPEPPKPAAKDWRDKEMARRARRIDEERIRADEAIAENKRLQDLVAASRQDPPPAEGEKQAPVVRQPAPVDPERRFTQAEVRAEAARIAAEDQFKRDFASAYDAGVKICGGGKMGAAKMDEAIGRISELGGLDGEHIGMILATDDPGKVLYELGSNPEEFQRIMDSSVPLKKRGVEFTKMGLKAVTPPKKQSGTPPPVEPLGGTGGTADNRYSDKIDDEAWFRAEEKRTQEHYKRKNSW